MPFEDDDIRWLLEVLEEHELQEIEVEQGDLRVRVSAVKSAAPQPAAPAMQAAPAPQPQEPAQQPSAPEAPAPQGVPVIAPMAGIFYRQPSPDADTFCEEGDRVEAGQVVGLIEVMKLFNEITAPVTGIVREFAVENEERVEADDPLMFISPASKKE